MNTPAHAMLSLVVLGTQKKYSGSQSYNAVIVAGALIPDAVIIVFYAWQLTIGTPEQVIWSTAYFEPFWQNAIDAFNSIPIILILMLVSWKLSQPLFWVLLASMLLHTLGDLPLHHDDGHRHFFPFIDWRFVSPVSYWDSAHHGRLASIVEMAFVFISGIYLLVRFERLRCWVAAILLVYIGYWIYVFNVWM